MRSFFFNFAYAYYQIIVESLSINGIKIAFEVSGNPMGYPVIILHGWGCDHSTVRFIASCLEDHMKVVNVDLPGHGSSEEPSTVWGTADFASVIVNLIQTLNLQDVSLIGHSFGGRTSILTASQTPVRKLVLVDSAGIKPKRSLDYYRKVYSFKLIKALAPVFLGKRKSQNLINKLRNKKGSADYNAASPMMKNVMSRCVNEDLKHILPAIDCPTLLIWGENDTATPLSDAKTIERLVPDAGLVAFPGCGHYSFLDNPGGFKSVIREFFKDELKS